MKTNFSKTQNEILDLALDLRDVNFTCYSIDGETVSQKDCENHLRELIKNDMLGGKTLYQAVRRNQIELYEITEELVNVELWENVLNSPFIDRFVDKKNRGLGDVTEFYAEGGLYAVATFAGNHWDTDRQSLDIGEAVTLPKEWIHIHVYGELEQFLLGIIDFNKMMDKVRKSINKFLQDRIYALFNTVGNAIPAEFCATGNTEKALGDHVDLIMAAGGYTTVTLAGTRGALRKVANAVPDKMFADSQKEAKAKTGTIGVWEGFDLMPIPQTLKSGTFELALSDSDVFIIGGESKPIKLEVFGDSRTKTNTDGQDNNDQTIDAQIQTKIGLGLILPRAFGKFTFS